MGVPLGRPYRELFFPSRDLSIALSFSLGCFKCHYLFSCALSKRLTKIPPHMAQCLIATIPSAASRTSPIWWLSCCMFLSYLVSALMLHSAFLFCTLHCPLRTSSILLLQLSAMLGRIFTSGTWFYFATRKTTTPSSSVSSIIHPNLGNRKE